MTNTFVYLETLLSDGANIKSAEVSQAIYDLWVSDLVLDDSPIDKSIGYLRDTNRTKHEHREIYNIKSKMLDLIDDDYLLFFSDILSYFKREYLKILIKLEKDLIEDTQYRIDEAEKALAGS